MTDISVGDGWAITLVETGLPAHIGLIRTHHVEQDLHFLRMAMLNMRTKRAEDGDVLSI
jgi:hypothetical protein